MSNSDDTNSGTPSEATPEVTAFTPLPNPGTPKDIPVLFVKFLDFVLTDAQFREALYDLNDPQYGTAPANLIKGELTSRFGRTAAQADSDIVLFKSINWQSLHEIEYGVLGRGHDRFTSSADDVHPLNA